MTVGYAWTGPTQPGTDVPGYFSVVVKNLPVSAFEMSVIDARLNGRRGPADAVLQVTDQYRQDEPHGDAFLTAIAAPNIQPFAAEPIILSGPKFKNREQVFIPNNVAINRLYSYSFAIHLQSLKHTGTGGRQYIINVSAEDADDGSSVNTAVIVPNSA